MFAMLAVGCAMGASKTQQLADSVTSGAYNNDVSAVTQNMDDALAGTVTRREVGDLSDRMHALGDYKGLTEVTSDDNARKYTYLARFTKGAMMVEMRLDSDGKIAAYRLVPQQLVQ